MGYVHTILRDVRPQFKMGSPGAYEEAVLGTTRLGVGLLFRHGGANDGRDDQELFGAPF
jgi:hypothetical protein